MAHHEPLLAVGVDFRLLRTSDPTLTAEDLAAAYKQLLAVERGWRDCKSSLGLRPVYHHREDRIRAHVQLCWLAMLLIRVAETRAGDTWRNLRHELDRMHLVTLATADGRVAQRSATTSDQKTILAALASSSASSRKSMAAYAESSLNPRQSAIATRSATQPVWPARRGPRYRPRPKLWITFAEGTPVTGWRSL